MVTKQAACSYRIREEIMPKCTSDLLGYLERTLHQNLKELAVLQLP
jgi:hypothetical protein